MAHLPMLSGKPDYETLRFPCIASPKIDGIRARIIGGVAVSRSNKPLKNRRLQSWAKHHEEHLNNLDGELTVGDPWSPTCFNITTSVIGSFDKTDEFTFWVFDIINETVPYQLRRKLIERRTLPRGAVLLDEMNISDMKSLERYEIITLKKGYEGVMTRDPQGFYKEGRATSKGQELLKIKHYEDNEAVVVGIAEEMHNANEEFTNELGRTARSSHKANKIGKNTAGAIIGIAVNGIHRGVKFRCSGFTDTFADELWANRNALPGSYFVFKHFAHGAVDGPRHPVFKGWRGMQDMDAADVRFGLDAVTPMLSPPPQIFEGSLA